MIDRALSAETEQGLAKTSLSAGFPVHVAEEHMKSLVTSIVASPKSRNLACRP